jgi:hypothetical protein
MSGKFTMNAGWDCVPHRQPLNRRGVQVLLRLAIFLSPLYPAARLTRPVVHP